MTDKELIKEEIERRISQFEAKYPKDLGGYWNDEESAAYDCAEEYKQFLLFIDSLLEEHNEDLELEEELDRRFGKTNNYSIGDFAKLYSRKDFKNGAEWQKKRDQETIELAEDHAMLAGMNRMKEEMMKDAVEGIVGGHTDIPAFINLEIEHKPNVKVGDKVKIIIVKEN